MVHRQQQHVLVVGQPQQRGAQQRAARQVERPLRLRRRQPLAPAASRSAAGSARRSISGSGSAPRPGRSPGPAARPRSRRSCAAPRGAARSRSRLRCERRHVERPAQAHGGGDVVGRAAGLELVEEPQPLLGERERQRAVARRPARSGGAAAARRAARRAPRSARPAPATVGASNRLRSGSSTSNASRTRAITWVASSEWPPSSKKLSWTPTRSTPQHLGPDAGQQLLDRRARRDDRRRPAPARRRSGAGSARRSTLPLGVSGSASSSTNADGTM